jgi:hypothetical protein
MTLQDPFNNAPAPVAPVATVPDEAQQPAAVGTAFVDVQARVDPALAEFVTGEQVRITYKSAAAYDAPWITTDFPSIDVAHARMTEVARQTKLVELFGITVKASGAFWNTLSATRPNAQAPTAAAAPSQPAAQSAPQGATQPPVGAPPKPFEDFVYVTKFSAKTNKAWHAWMPPTKGDSRPALFFNA